MLSRFNLFVIAALLQGAAMGFKFAPGQSHSQARAMFHRVVRGENVDEDDLSAAPAVEANTETDDNEEEDGAVSKSQRRSDESRLLREVFYHYDDYVFPGKTLQVSYGISYQCANYDKSTHVLTSRVYERIIWNDDRLAWNASDYDGIDSIRIRPWRLWLPDIQVFNEADSEGCKDWINALVLSTGTIIWFPPTTFRTFCKPTGKSSAECQIRLGSWSYNTDYLTLAPFKYTQIEQFDLSDYIEECPYTVSDAESEVTEPTYPGFDESYSTLDIKFKIRASN